MYVYIHIHMHARTGLSEATVDTQCLLKVLHIVIKTEVMKQQKIVITHLLKCYKRSKAKLI